MYETSNDLASTTRRSAVEILNEHLADAIDLHLQAKQAHWNIKGPNFVGLHEMYDRVAAQPDEYSDLIAERAVALGGFARGSGPVHRDLARCRQVALDGRSARSGGPGRSEAGRGAVCFAGRIMIPLREALPSASSG